MIAAAGDHWSPEQWLVLIGGVITLLGGQVVIIIKLVRGDRKTDTTAAELATKVNATQSVTAASHNVVVAKVDEIRDEQHRQAEEQRKTAETLAASIAVRQRLSNTVDGHEVRLNDHARRITAAEAQILQIVAPTPETPAPSPQD